MAHSIEVFLGTNGQQDIVLLANGVVQSSADFNRVTLQVGTTLLDSAVLPSLFVWPLVLTYKRAAVNGIRLKLGVGSGLVAGTYASCRLLTYSATYPQGFPWSDDLEVVVK